jgi:hypothetical protein
VLDLYTSFVIAYITIIYIAINSEAGPWKALYTDTEGENNGDGGLASDGLPDLDCPVAASGSKTLSIG